MCVEQSNIEKGLDQWINSVLHIRGGLVAQKTENLPAGETEFHPQVGKISWRRAWQPPPAFVPGEVHGQRSLVGYSP